MENNDSSSMIISGPKTHGIVVIPDSETSDSNTTTTTKNNTNLIRSINATRKRPRNDCHEPLPATAAAAAKFKGVVPQQNGNWGAQIYANHQRVWLGTFKTASLAAMAYDSAAIKLRTGDLHRNFPWSGLTLQEPQFQGHYSAEAVLTMIKDGSYQSKFEHFVRARSMTLTKELMLASNKKEQASVEDRGGARSEGSHLVTKLLFQKELTPSDVGKLNRLVIPKKFAVKYFPYISEENFIIDSDDVELVFYDKHMTPWRFRYCYWKSSQSYVFTRGWNRFVKDNKLKANDVVTFYSRDQYCSDNTHSFCLIDVTHHNHNHSSTIDHTKRGLLLDNNNVINIISEDRSKGFRLFGVDIK